MVSLNNSKDIVANSISVIDKHKVIDLKELFLSKVDAKNSIVGLPVETLNSLQQLGEAINNDGDVFNSMTKQINLKSDISYVTNQIYIIITKFLNYDTREQSNVKLLLKSDRFNTYNMSEVDL
jgi:ribonuclease PH